MQANRPARWKILLAFAIIYFVWGSTFLAIRVGVREIPPLLFGAIRFLAAGLALIGWAISRGEPAPTGRQWRSAFLLAILLFVLDYGLLFWAEQRVPSGVAAIMMSTISIYMALSEIVLLRTQRLTPRLALALLAGIAGVVVLTGQSLHFGGAPIDRAGGLALVVAPIGWSIGSTLSRKLPLPSSKVMNSGSQMLAGGTLLTVTSAALGEFRNFHPDTIPLHAWMALLYLTVAGSIVGYTAYVWLLHYESPTKVGTYAYVNPVVAVLVGHFLGGETTGPRTILGALLILTGVVAITTNPARLKQ